MNEVAIDMLRALANEWAAAELLASLANAYGECEREEARQRGWAAANNAEMYGRLRELCARAAREAGAIENAAK